MVDLGMECICVKNGGSGPVEFSHALDLELAPPVIQTLSPKFIISSVYYITQSMV